MDIQTLILMLAVSNLIFGLELILFQLREPYSARNPYWIAAKMLQCLGWLLLAGRNDLPTMVVVPFGNGAILCGLAYECWARDTALSATLAQWAYYYDLEAFTMLFRPAEEGGH